MKFLHDGALLGEGAFASVRRAESKATKASVAIKQIDKAGIGQSK